MILEEIIEKDKYYESEYKDKDEEHERKVEKGKATASSMRQKAIESLVPWRECILRENEPFIIYDLW